MSDIAIGHSADLCRSVVGGYQNIKVPIEGFRWVIYTSVAMLVMSREAYYQRVQRYLELPNREFQLDLRYFRAVYASSPSGSWIRFGIFPVCQFTLRSLATYTHPPSI